MKKQYQSASVEITTTQGGILMIPSHSPIEPVLAPARIFNED